MARSFRLATPDQRSCKAPEADGPESIRPYGACHPELVLLMVQMREGWQLTLPTLIARIRQSPNAVPAALGVFERRLGKARYVDEHAQRYPTP